jgi:hypothetical protein
MAHRPRRFRSLALMIKLFLIPLIVLLSVSSLNAEEPSYPILYPKGGSLVLKACEEATVCTFSGTQTLSGRYYFGFSDICDNGEEDGCVTLKFYPDDLTVLPHFKGWKFEFIDISNYKEGAEKLMGKALVEKVISAGRATVQAKAPGQYFGEVIAVKGTATLVIEDYLMGLWCDSCHAYAKILKVTRKSKSQPIAPPDGR